MTEDGDGGHQHQAQLGQRGRQRCLMNTSVNDVWVASCHRMIDLGCPSLVIPF